MNKEIWKGWGKNIDYSVVVDPDMRQWVLEVEYNEKSSFTFSVIHMEKQRLEGVNYVVEKRVSDDLLDASLGNINFSNIPWPSNSIEMYFEDPAIPTLLIQKFTKEEIHATAGKFNMPTQGIIESMPSGEIIWSYVHSGKGYLHLSQTPDVLNGWVCGVPVDSGTKGTCFKEAPSAQENANRELLLLAYKVLLYAAVPQLAPSKVTSKSLRFGGKPGVKGRPDRPIYRVVDLPKVYREGKVAQVIKFAGKVFRGRHGHFHHYRSDVFVNKQGTFEYWPPVLGPDGTLPKIKYKVRKPDLE